MRNFNTGINKCRNNAAGGNNIFLTFILFIKQTVSGEYICGQQTGFYAV